MALSKPTDPELLVLEERVNQRVAHFLQTLTVDDIKRYNPTSSKHHCKTEEDFQKALNKLKAFLSSILGKASVQRTYCHSRGKDFGRMLCFKGIQNVWRAFRGALCKGIMTDIDMKNAHPVILLWICEKLGIECPKLREYVEHRDHHLKALAVALNNGSDREQCKRLFLVATNTNQAMDHIPYAFFVEYQAEIRSIQDKLMTVEELAWVKPHAEEAARAKAAKKAAQPCFWEEEDDEDGNEEGSFLNLVLCYSENILIQAVHDYLKSDKGIVTAVLMHDGLMVYGDYYGDKALLEELHSLLKTKFGINMYFDYKEHETTVLDAMPDDFDESKVLGTEWTSFLLNIDDAYLRDPTHMQRILSACHGQGRSDGNLLTWEYAARKLWWRSGRDPSVFDGAWQAVESPHHDGSTLRYYSRESKEAVHYIICRKALGLGGRCKFNELELRNYFLKAVGDDLLCLEGKKDFCMWNNGRWIETDGAVLADRLMTVVHDMYSSNLTWFEAQLTKLLASGGNADGNEAKAIRDKIGELMMTANCYGNGRNQGVLALVKNRLRKEAKTLDPFDAQPYYFAFTNCAYDLTRQRGKGGWFHPDKYDFLLMSCKKPWRNPTDEETAKVRSWFESIFPDEALRKAYISILKSALSGERFEYFFVATGSGRNGKGLLNEHFIYLLDMNGYAVIGHLHLLTKEIKSGPNTEARSLHKKRFVRFSEPNPGENMEAVRLSNVNELTGNEQLKARTLHETDDDTRLHSTSLLECNDPPACVGDKGDSSQERWRFIPFRTKFTDDAAELASDPVKFRPKDPTLKSEDAKKKHYCALFKYLVTAEGVWKPGDSLDSYMPEETKTLAKKYLAKNDELSSWFLDQFEQDVQVDAAGNVVNFVPIKEIKALYEMGMTDREKRNFTAGKLKEDIEKNIVLKKFFRQANKVKLASTRKLNKKEGLIHFKRKNEADSDDEDAPTTQRARLIGGSVLDQFND